MNGTLAAAGAAVVAAVLVAAGCGGSGDSSGGGGSASATPTESWADDLCSATATWRDELTQTVNSVTDGTPTRDDLKSAADEAQDDTQSYLDSLDDLGKPDTEAGEDAKAAVDRLRTELRTGADTVKTTIDEASGVSGTVNAVAVISATLTTMRQEVADTITQLKQLDASGELKQAFSDSDACASLED